MKALFVVTQALLVAPSKLALNRSIKTRHLILYMSYLRLTAYLLAYKPSKKNLLLENVDAIYHVIQVSAKA